MTLDESIELWQKEHEHEIVHACNMDAEVHQIVDRVNPWHTGTPTVEEIDKDNQYCYALCFYYDGWWLSDYLFKANHEEGCFENSPNNGQKVCKFKFCETIAWQKIEENEDGRTD